MQEGPEFSVKINIDGKPDQYGENHEHREELSHKNFLAKFFVLEAKKCGQQRNQQPGTSQDQSDDDKALEEVRRSIGKIKECEGSRCSQKDYRLNEYRKDVEQGRGPLL